MADQEQKEKIMKEQTEDYVKREDRWRLERRVDLMSMFHITKRGCLSQLLKIQERGKELCRDWGAKEAEFRRSRGERGMAVRQKKLRQYFVV